MPTTIKQRLDEIIDEPSGTTMNVLIEPKIQALILKMVVLPEWESFIEEFIAPDNSENLKKAQRDRLKLDDNTTNPYIRQSVAYLFANSVCTGTSRNNLTRNIETILDNDIDLTQ